MKAQPQFKLRLVSPLLIDTLQKCKPCSIQHEILELAEPNDHNRVDNDTHKHRSQVLWVNTIKKTIFSRWGGSYLEASEAVMRIT